MFISQKMSANDYDSEVDYNKVVNEEANYVYLIDYKLDKIIKKQIHDTILTFSIPIK